jgi:hypothetical protein
MPSVFVGNGQQVDYPAYLVTINTTDGTYGFFVANGNDVDSFPAGTPGLGGSSDTGLLSAIASWIEANNWEGQSVTSVTVTEYTETASDVSL